MSHKEYITPDTVHAPTWQFNHAVKVNGGSLLFVSGMVGYRTDGTMPRGLVEQAEVAFENLQRVLEAAGGSVEDIVKVNVYVGEDYRLHREGLRAVRARFFSHDFPVSTLVQVAGFADPDYLFEIEAVAALPE